MTFKDKLNAWINQWQPDVAPSLEQFLLYSHPAGGI